MTVDTKSCCPAAKLSVECAVTWIGHACKPVLDFDNLCRSVHERACSLLTRTSALQTCLHTFVAIVGFGVHEAHLMMQPADDHDDDNSP